MKDGQILNGPRSAKIAQIIRDISGKGGAERVFVETANLLSGEGQTVTCLHYGKDIANKEIGLSDEVSLVNLARPVPNGVMSFVGNRKVRRAAKLATRVACHFPVLRKTIWNAHHGRFRAALTDHFRRHETDVAISYLPSASTPMLLAAKHLDVRTICTNHNRPEADYADRSRWDPNPLDIELRLKVLQDADAIHVLFPEFAEWFPASLRDRIRVIPNFVSPDILKLKPAQKRDLRIIAVGRLAPVKQLDVLIKAWALIAEQHPDWSITLHGDGPELERLKDLTEQTQTADSVIFEPFTRDFGSAYARASILCHPARFEGFGLAVAEALALGLPVVAFSDCSGVNQLVRHRRNGLLVDRQGGVEAIAEALNLLISDTVLWQHCSKNGPQSVSAYNVEAYKSNWTKLISSVLGDD